METETTPPDSIKLLVIDIDGTLLNPEGKITVRTLAAVRAAQEAGIMVTLATARRYCNSVQIARELGIEGPLILYDGALIVRHPHATIVHSHRLQADIAQQAVELLVHYNLQPVVHPATSLQEEIWTGPAESDNPWLTAYFASYPGQLRRMPHKHLCTDHASPWRVIGFDSEERILALTPELTRLDCSWTSIKRGSFGCAEIAFMERDCSKASGVAVLAQLLAIPLQQVMAIGDNNNDLQMLQVVGWGVAMGQAPDSVKAVAQAVTASNAEDGAAQAIERYALRSAPTMASNSLKRWICL